MKLLNIMKKFICISMLFVLVLLPVSVNAEEYSYNEEIEFLSKIGVEGVNESVQNAEITRAEAALYFAQALNYDNNNPDAVQAFLDVDKSDKAFYAVWHLRSIGAISDSEDKLFRPNDKLTHNELLKMATVILGYEQYAKIKGGWPYGYTDAAVKAKLTGKLINDGSLTKGEVYSVIYNMLFAYTLEIDSLFYEGGSNTAVSFAQGKLLLEKVYELAKYSGQIMATYYASIYGSTAPSREAVVIDGNTYRSIAEIALSDVGAYVDYYVTKDNVCYMVMKKNIEEYIINSDDIAHSTTPLLITYKTEEREKNYKVAENAYYMYNARPVISPTDAQIKPKYGKLELIDNNNDKIIDVVKIWDYKSYYIENIANDKIYVEKNSEDITYIKYKNTSKTVTVFDRRMNQVEDKLVIPGKVVTVAETDDNIIMILSDDVFEGKLESITSDGKAVIDGLEYNYLSSCDLSDAFGKKLKYYIDVNETIVYTNVGTKTDYAILYGIEKPEVFAESVRVMLYDKGYFDIYNCEKRVRLSLDGGATFDTVSCTELYDKFYDSSQDNIKKQLIKYEKHDNKISAVIAARETKEVNEDEFRLNMNYGEDVEWNMGTRQVMFKSDDSSVNYMWSNTGTYCYLISDDEKDCTYASMNSLFGGHYAVYGDSAQYYTNVKGYDLTELGYLKYIVVEIGGEKAVEKTTSYSSPLALVTGRKTVLDNDGSAIEVITAYTNENGLRTVPTVSNLSPNNAELSNTVRAHHTRYSAGSVKFSELEPGDIIQYAQDTFSGRIVAFTLLSRADDIDEDYSNNNFGANRWDSVISGTVTAKSEYGIKITGSQISHSVYGNSIPIMMDTTINTPENFDKVYRYDSKAQAFELITANDVYEGARVWCYVEDKYYQYGVILVVVE